MTDITDQDRRVAHEWAASVDPEMDRLSDSTRAVARVILATVDAPAPTLAERLQYRADLLDNGDPDGDTPQALRDLAAHAAKMEHDLTEARAEVERLTAVNENLRRTDNYREFREQFLTVQKDAESNAESLDPADVPAGEAWIVEWKDTRHVSVRVSEDHWWIWRSDAAYPTTGYCSDITLISRLVPAPRVITNTDELEALPHRTVIRDSDGDMFQRIAHGWYQAGYESVHRSDDNFVCLPVTVLWEPEA